MQCTKCGFVNDDAGVFCINCGEKLQSEQPLQSDTQFKQPEPVQPAEQFQQNQTYQQPDQYYQPQQPPQYNVQNQFIPPPKLKNSLFGELFFKKDSDFGLLFLAAFFLQISYVLSSIILYATKSPLPTITSPIFSIISFLLFVTTIMFYFKKKSDDSTFKIKENLISTILSAIVCFIFLIFITLLFGIIYRQLYMLLPQVFKGQTNTLLFLAFMVLLAILLTIVTLSATTLFVAIFEYNLKINMLGKIYFSILLRFLTGFFRVLIYSIIFGALLYATNLLNNVILSILDILKFHGFIKVFILYLFVALMYGYIFYLLINISKKLLMKMDSAIKGNIPKTNKKAVPIFACVVIILTIGLIIYTVPLNAKTTDKIITEIKIHMQQAETYGNVGLSELSIFENNLAYSKLLSLRGYLEALANIKEPNQIYSDSSQRDLGNASVYSTKNRYLPYFYGKLNLLSQNNSGAISNFKVASYFDGGIPEAYIGLLEAYKETDDKTNVALMFDVLTGQGIFHDYYSDMQRFNVDKIDNYIDKLNTIEENLGPKMIYNSIEKIKYLDCQTALNELLELQKKYPNNAEVSYYIAKTANQLKSEQNNYSLVKTYAEAFDRQLDTSSSISDEINKKLFVAQMYIDSDNKPLAEQTLQSLYLKYPDDKDVSEQYAFILNENKKPDEAIKVLEKEILKSTNSYKACFLIAESYIIKNDPAKSLENMQKFLSIAKKDSGLIATVDKYLYSYSLEFSYIFSGDLAIAEVEKVKDNVELYNYLYAIKGWKEKDSDKSNGYIQKVIDANKKLGYAYYVMGVNYFEKAVRTGSTDFSLSEKNYLKSIDLLPSHVEGYFAIGHCYLKWGKNAEALRAFRKVVDLLPYEDHRTDRYGMTVHAQGMVSQLSQYDIKEVE